MHPRPLMIPIRQVSTMGIQMFFYAITKALNITFSIYFILLTCFFCFLFFRNPVFRTEL